MNEVPSVPLEDEESSLLVCDQSPGDVHEKEDRPAKGRLSTY